MTRLISCAAILLAACATTGDDGSAPLYTPFSGAGPFLRLAPDDSYPFTAPYVLEDATADFDDPSVIADGSQLTVWFTSHRKNVVQIERAEAPSLTAGFGSPAPVLVADAAWEMGAVAAPSVIAGPPFLLFYSAAGAIGVATSSDGITFAKFATPTLTADGASEGMTLGSPGAVRIGDVVRIYYPASNSLWAAEAPFAALAAGTAATWTRVDGDPTTAARDPIVDSVPYGVSLGRAMSRVVTTPAGRPRHDLYFTVTQPNSMPTAIGFAASYTGDRFSVAATPILTPPSASGPSVVDLGSELLMLFAALDGRDAITAAHSP